MYKILWFDNEPNQIKTVKDLISKNEEIYIKEVNVLEDFMRIRKNLREFDLCILDYEIDKDFNIEIVIDIIDKPIIIFTNFIEDVLGNEIVYNHPNLIGIIDKSNQDELIKLIEDLSVYEPFTICHLSDIHFDSSLNKKEKSNQLNRINSFFEVIQNKVDYAFITGDFVDKNIKQDYEELLPIIKTGFNDVFGKSYKDKTFIIPGNHDILWDNYDSSDLNERCFNDYLGFYLNFYGGNIQEGLIDFVPTKFVTEPVKSMDSCWYRSINKNLSIIGLNSSVREGCDKGEGVFTIKHKELISKHWSKKKLDGELRLLLVHHNIFVPPSFSHVEEKKQINENGLFIKTILKSDCDLVLSGHSHNPNLVNFSFSSLVDNITKYDKLKSFSNISSGTFGGFSATGRNLNFFSILKFLPTKIDGVIKWKVMVVPYQYNTDDDEWKTNTQNEGQILI